MQMTQGPSPSCFHTRNADVAQTAAYSSQQQRGKLRLQDDSMKKVEWKTKRVIDRWLTVCARGATESEPNIRTPFMNPGPALGKCLVSN